MSGLSLLSKHPAARELEALTDEEHLHLLHPRLRELPVDEQAKLNNHRIGLLCEPFRAFADNGGSEGEFTLEHAELLALCTLQGRGRVLSHCSQKAACAQALLSLKRVGNCCCT